MKICLNEFIVIFLLTEERGLIYSTIFLEIPLRPTSNRAYIRYDHTIYCFQFVCVRLKKWARGSRIQFYSQAHTFWSRMRLRSIVLNRSYLKKLLKIVSIFNKLKISIFNKLKTIDRMVLSYIRSIGGRP